MCFNSMNSTQKRWILHKKSFYIPQQFKTLPIKIVTATKLNKATMHTGNYFLYDS